MSIALVEMSNITMQEKPKRIQIHMNQIKQFMWKNIG